MRESYSYQSVLGAAERVAFRLDDVLPRDAELQFDLPFLPDRLTRTERHQELSRAERLRFNQIFGHTYLCMFGLVEEFILPFVLDHVRAAGAAVNDATRALLGFANEEAKHIELFRRFRDSFERGFGSHCEVVGPADQVVRAVLAHRPLSVALTILHIEWLTQRHYVESVRSEERLEPRIKNLLKQHWLEEAQHAKLDTLLVEQLAGALPQRLIDEAVDEYLSILTVFDQLLAQQAKLDMASLALSLGRPLATRERDALERTHHQALRDTFLGSGMTHPSFLSTVALLSPQGAARVKAAVVSFRNNQGEAQ